MHIVRKTRAIFFPCLFTKRETVIRQCSVKKVFLKFRNIHMETPVLESLVWQDSEYVSHYCPKEKQ